MATSDIATRILEGDAKLWVDTSVAPNRLGWLRAPETTQEELDDLHRWAESVDQSHILVLGMGGSSLGPRVFAEFLANHGGAQRQVTIIDSTDPRSVADIPLTDTAVIVSSKSGTTVETEAYRRFFFERLRRPDRFYAITDPGTPLAEAAIELGFKRIFSTPEDVGGRFSALTYFGIVPAALAGIDLVALFEALAKVDHSHWADLGTEIAEAALTGTIPVQLIRSEQDRALGMWTEQILAESTGKEGKGLLPVPVAAKEGDYPRSTLPVAAKGISELASHIFGMEVAIAAAGHVLGIDPFNEPDVGVSKAITRRILAGEKFDPKLPSTGIEDLAGYLESELSQGQYVAISAYQPLHWEDELYRLRDGIAARLPLHPVTAGLAPRHLHSTGQLQKGGPKLAHVVQIVSADYGASVPIPDLGTNFNTLIRAQADGDAVALAERGQRVTRVVLD
ncbi:MAG: hypothetical protein M0Z91_06680 [Actinomycetota bacterium]|nr:hypothetical protein [Actinomycetota bacterium]